MFRARDERLGVVRSLLGLAAVAAAEHRWHRALELLSAEEALRSDLGLPFPPDWTPERARVEDGAREHLSTDETDGARRRGASPTWADVEELLGPSAAGQVSRAVRAGRQAGAR